MSVMKARQSFREKFWVTALAILVLLALALFWFSTPHGLALVNDSVLYIDGARNLLQGNGYSRLVGWGGTVPITNFPPFYSFVLALIMALGIAPIQASWWVSLVFLAVNVVLVSLLGREVTQSVAFGVLAGGLALISDPFFRHHLFALTEPVFLFYYFLSLLLLIRFLKQRRWYQVLLAGLFAGLSYLTRYIGITLFATGVIFLLVFQNEWNARLKSAGIFLAGGLPFFLGWTVRNFVVAGNPTNRQFMLRTLAADKIQEGITSFWGWLLPEPYQIISRFIDFWGIALIIFLILFTGGFMYAVWLALKKLELRGHKDFQASWLLGLQSLIYLITLAVTILFIDSSVNFETRVLMPAYVLWLLLFVALLAWLWRFKHWATTVLALVLVVGLSLSFAEDTLDTIRQWRQQGQGFAHESWTTSQTIEMTKQLPKVNIFTNRPQAVNLLAQRGAYILLSPVNAATQLPREGYQEEQARIRQMVVEGKAVVVIFGFQDLIQDAENSWMLELTAGLPVLFEYEKDIVFGNLTLIQD
ncbi:MAG: glycosyltransferase family 39 protein [Anaerolineales bacterium]